MHTVEALSKQSYWAKHHAPIPSIRWLSHRLKSISSGRSCIAMYHQCFIWFHSGMQHTIWFSVDQSDKIGQIWIARLMIHIAVSIQLSLCLVACWSTSDQFRYYRISSWHPAMNVRSVGWSVTSIYRIIRCRSLDIVSSAAHLCSRSRMTRSAPANNKQWASTHCDVSSGHCSCGSSLDFRTLADFIIVLFFWSDNCSCASKDSSIKLVKDSFIKLVTCVRSVPTFLINWTNLSFPFNQSLGLSVCTYLFEQSIASLLFSTSLVQSLYTGAYLTVLCCYSYISSSRLWGSSH